MPKEIARLPLPEHLEPDTSSRSLMSSVRNYFYMLYNASNSRFKDMLVSVGNRDSITGRRDFDRHEATLMIKTAAKGQDPVVTNAKDGEIYQCIVQLMRKHNLGLKLRRANYKSLTQPAE